MTTGFTVVLHLTCSTSGECSDAELMLKSLPSVGLDLKREIELAYEIPVFVQTLTYGTEDSLAVIADDDPITNAVLRHGDRLQVSYTSRAECKDVESAVNYLEKLATSFKQQFPKSNDASPSALLLNQAFREGMAQLLRIDLFMPWRSSVKQMNKEVFLRAGGLHYIIQLLQHVQASDWSTSIRNVKVLEILLLGTLHPLAANFRFRRLLVQEGVVELCLKSLLRHKLEREAISVGDEVTRFLLSEAMTTLCNLCEVHETHVKVGSNGEAQEQLICIAHSSDYDTWNAQVVLNLMVCLAHATEVHPNLASNSIVGGIVDICALRQKVSDCGANELMLLRYYAQLVFIQLILFSPIHLSQESLEKLETFVAEFIRDVDPLAIAKQEQTSGNFWSVFEPFVSLLYVPDSLLGKSDTDSRHLLLERLRCSSIHSALIALNVIILCFTDGHKSLEIMQRENLIPFVILAPSHVPSSLKPQATELVHGLGRYTPINPPALSDLAKASLAKHKFGLKRMLHLVTPHELVIEYYSV